MPDIEVSYKGSQIGALSNSGTMTILTEGTYCEDDIELTYTKSGGGGGTDISDSDVTENDVLSPKKVYVWDETRTPAAAVKKEGTIQTKAAATYGASSSDQTIAAGQYLGGAQTIRGVTTSNISAGNIKDGVVVKVGDASDDDAVTSVTGSFTDSSTVSTGQTAAGAGQILEGYSAWVDGAEVQGSIKSKSATDLSASGPTVTVPAGHYASEATKTIASGVATAPSQIVASGATVTASFPDNFTLATSAPISVTPVIATAGYVSSGTAGSTSISLSTTNIAVKSAGTYYPYAGDQTINAGTYLNGAQTFKGVVLTNLEAANIKSGVTVKVGDADNTGRVASVTGTFSGYPESDALVAVTVPYGTDVEMQKIGGITLYPQKRIVSPGGNTDSGYECAMFDVPPAYLNANSWTVTATNGSSTETGTIVTRASYQYEMELNPILNIIHNGKLYPRFTGNVTNSNYGFIEQQSENVLFQVNSGTRTVLAYMTPVIDVTGYTNLRIKFYPWGTNNTCTYYVGLKSTNTADTNNWGAKTNGNTEGSSTTWHTVDLPLNGLTGNYYFAIYGKSTSNSAIMFRLEEAVLSR